ncbi:Alpha/beta hydrolase fold-1 [Dimargaris cristalligena]|uniref:Alpha/beta hydrolase fold-1 n=1 Tax=Dimargaris cristalligena TaxID=215637 RepID=A0A4P9ZL09_9FUNG|nr:Alpha/beta hydrolase fold-1 [Dimargaris cristalligena]|eukprot:RKP33785.1 Alpha/beta hydrolase fold-1 [Dimargaris cristalligena]
MRNELTSRFTSSCPMVKGARPGQRLVAEVFRPNSLTTEAGPTLPGQPVTLLMAHASGFHKEVWYPIINDLSLTSAAWAEQPYDAGVRAYRAFPNRLQKPKRGESATPGDETSPTPGPAWYIHHIIVFDVCDHGDSAALNQPTLPSKTTWFDNARDIIALVDQLSCRGALIGIGHSYGATSMLLAQIMWPTLFDALLMIEPAIPFAGRHYWEMRFDFILKRKRVWPDYTSALAYFQKHPFYQSWDPRSLAIYIQYGLTPMTADPLSSGGSAESESSTKRNSGQDPGPIAVTFKCTPEVEHQAFLAGAIDGVWLFNRLIDIVCPLRYIMGTDSNICPNDRFAQAHVSASYTADLHFIAQSGHMVVMESPQTIADQVSRFIGHGLAWQKGPPALQPRL